VTAAALIYGNGINLLPEDSRDDAKLYANIAVTAFALALGLTLRFTPRELGLHVTWRGALIGLALGVAVVPVGMYLLLADAGDSVGAENVEGLSAAGIAWRAGVRILVGTAIAEEVLFRGLLYALWMRAAGTGTAIAATAIAFGLWHCVISLESVRDAEVGGPGAFAGLAYAATLIGLAAAGAVFALLRRWTSNLAAPVTLHWTVNGLSTVFAWLRA
jgi:membrane protease YdiL (CAAX protease family)